MHLNQFGMKWIFVLIMLGHDLALTELAGHIHLPVFPLYSSGTSWLRVGLSVCHQLKFHQAHLTHIRVRLRFGMKLDKPKSLG